MTGSLNRQVCTTSTVFRDIPLTFSSTIRPVRPTSTRRAASIVGMDSPFPASRALTALNDKRSIGPFPLVVRLTVESCSTTRAPSAVHRTSISTKSTPRAMPFRIAAKVFSGACPAAPRCPILSIRRKGSLGAGTEEGLRGLHIREWNKSKVVLIQVAEILLHAVSFVYLHGLNDLVVNLQQPQAGRDLIRTDDKQIHPQCLRFHLCLHDTVVNKALVQSQEIVQLKKVSQWMWVHSNALLRNVEKEKHRITSKTERLFDRERVGEVGVKVSIPLHVHHLEQRIESHGRTDAFIKEIVLAFEASRVIIAVHRDIGILIRKNDRCSIFIPFGEDVPHRGTGQHFLEINLLAEPGQKRERVEKGLHPLEFKKLIYLVKRFLNFRALDESSERFMLRFECVHQAKNETHGSPRDSKRHARTERENEGYELHRPPEIVKNGSGRSPILGGSRHDSQQTR